MTIAEPWQIRLAQALSMGIGLDKQWNVKRIRNVSNKEMWNSEIRWNKSERERTNSKHEHRACWKAFVSTKQDAARYWLWRHFGTSDQIPYVKPFYAAVQWQRSTQLLRVARFVWSIFSAVRPANLCGILYDVTDPKIIFGPQILPEAWKSSTSGTIRVTWFEFWGESMVPALKPFAWNFTSATLGSTICPGTARNLYAQVVLSINFRTPKPKMWTSYIFWMPQHTLQPAAPPTGGVGGHFGAIRIYLRNVETKFATPITGLGSYYKVTRNNVNNTNKMHGATAILGRNYAKWQGAPRCRPTSSSRDLAI